jgi:hypothetical protein
MANLPYYDLPHGHSTCHQSLASPEQQQGSIANSLRGIHVAAHHKLGLAVVWSACLTKTYLMDDYLMDTPLAIKA